MLAEVAEDHAVRNRTSSARRVTRLDERHQTSLERFEFAHLGLHVVEVLSREIPCIHDEGKGTPLVFVHGTPTWSLLYRRLIAWGPGCARALLGAGAWYEQLWAERDRLRRMPMLLLWGMQDPAFGPAYLARWEREFPSARVHTYAASGHFVPEEAADETAPLLERFVDDRAPCAESVA